MKNSIWFNDQVAIKTNSLHAAIFLNHFHEITKYDKGEKYMYVELDYKNLFNDFPNDYMNLAQSIRKIVRKLEECDFGYMISGVKGRPARFVITSEYYEPTDFIEGPYLTGKGVKTGYIHNLLCQLYSGYEVNKYESQIAYEIANTTKEVVSFEGVRKAMRHLNKIGYLVYSDKKTKKQGTYKKGYGHKIIKSVKEL